VPAYIEIPAAKYLYNEIPAAKYLYNEIPAARYLYHEISLQNICCNLNALHLI